MIFLISYNPFLFCYFSIVFIILLSLIQLGNNYKHFYYKKNINSTNYNDLHSNSFKKLY